MADIKISVSAQQALLKLLHKVHLIDAPTSNQRCTSNEWCPIGWLAQQGKLNE